MTVKAGDTVRRVKGQPWAPVGYVTKLYVNGAGDLRYMDAEGNEDVFIASNWELTNSPVRTETITRTVIEPGVYGLLEVGGEAVGHPTREVMLRVAPDHGAMVCASAAELRELARIATELADGLDAQ